MAGGEVMLGNAIDGYLAMRRAAGFELEVPEYLLRSFARFAASQKETSVRAQSVVEWASGAPSLSQRDHRLKTVLRFARYARLEDERHEIPPKDIFGYRKKRRVPFIYSDTEVLRLLKAASKLGPPGTLRPYTYQILFALLITTGLRISEALKLHKEDITADGLVVRETKFHKSRMVPLHETTHNALDDYLKRREEFPTQTPHLFISIRGQTLDRSSVQWTFRRILSAIGLDPAPNGRWPRIHDMRHTYAVRVLEQSPEGRDDIGRHMLALSTCMGHSNVADTYWYFEATPHLLRDIASACESFVENGGKT